MRQVTIMAFLKQKNPEFDGVCDNCGTELDEADNPIEDDGDGHEFCSSSCKDEYEDDHDHGDDEERDICEFC